jgi:hypothetical protein
MREPIPHRVYKVRVVGVGRDRLLVEREIGLVVSGQGSRLTPIEPAVGRATDQDRFERRLPRRIERDADLIGGTVTGDGHPRITGPLIITAIGNVAAGAAA